MDVSHPIRRTPLGVEELHLAQAHLCTAFTGHRAACPGATSTSGGSDSWHAATFTSQRGSNAHPGGREAIAGTVPSIVSSGLVRSERSVGTARRRPRV